MNWWMNRWTGEWVLVMEKWIYEVSEMDWLIDGQKDECMRLTEIDECIYGSMYEAFGMDGWTNWQTVQCMRCLIGMDNGREGWMPDWMIQWRDRKMYEVFDLDGWMFDWDGIYGWIICVAHWHCIDGPLSHDWLSRMSVVPLGCGGQQRRSWKRRFSVRRFWPCKCSKSSFRVGLNVSVPYSL